MVHSHNAGDLRVAPICANLNTIESRAICWIDIGAALSGLFFLRPKPRAYARGYSLSRLQRYLMALS
jgi:hypothetical protein